MEKTKKLNLMLGLFGVFLTFISSALAVIGGFHMFLVYGLVYGAGMLTMLSGIVLIAACIIGAITVGNNSLRALVAAILSMISSTTIACCLGIPMFDVEWIRILPIVAVILSFIAFLLFMTCYVKAKPHKAVEAEPTAETEVAAEMKTSAKRSAMLWFAIPIAIMSVLMIVIIPSVRFGVYKWAYKCLLHEMTDMHEEYCIHSVGFHTFDKYLPDSYKDVAKIRAEEREYHVLDCMNVIQGYSRNSEDEQMFESRARVAYMRLMELQSVDSRWNFDSFLAHPLQYQLFDNAMWQGDGVYLYIARNIENQKFTVDTNLPRVPFEYDFAELVYESHEYSYEQGGIMIYAYDTIYNQYENFKISALRYSNDTKEFSIDVYCYATDTTFTMTYVESAAWSDFQ